MSTLVITVLTLVLTILAIYTNRASRNDPSLRVFSALLWGICTATWILFAVVLFLIGWPAGNTYLATGAAMLGMAMAFISAVMVIVPLIDWVRERRTYRRDFYEEQKRVDRERIYKLTRRAPKGPPDLW